LELHFFYSSQNDRILQQDKQLPSSTMPYVVYGEFHEIIAFREPKCEGSHHCSMFIDRGTLWLMFKERHNNAPLKARLVLTPRGATSPDCREATIINFACIDPTNAERCFIHSKDRQISKAKIILYLTQCICAERPLLEKITIKMAREELPNFEALFTILMNVSLQSDSFCLPVGWFPQA
jgi:hypothetical protein